MGTFSGTYRADTITPELVSAGVVRTPAGSKPSPGIDRIDGGDGNDILDGGGGKDTIIGGGGHDTIVLTAAGGMVHGDAGDDEITVTPDLVWSRMTVEPDDFAVGTSLGYALTGVDLSVTGERATTVIAANGIIDDPGPGAPTGPHNFATTGTVLFGQDPANAPGGGFGQGLPLWNEDEFGQLRVDFDRPTNLVSIDLAFDDDDVGSLKAFSADGALLEEVTGSGRGPETFTATIARATPDISYVLAGGVASEALYLDNLRYNLATTAAEVSNTVYGDAGNDHIVFGYNTADALSDGLTLSGVVSLHGGDGNDNITVWADCYGSAGEIDFGTTKFEQFGEAGDDMLHAMDYFYTERVNYGAADDYLYGGAGNDIYILQEGADLVIEKPGEGYDTVIGYADGYTLAANVEKLQLRGSADSGPMGMSGTGNALDNVIIGADGGDTLEGMGGNDTIFGNNGWVDYDDADTIHGGTGNDLIYGGSGSDTDTWDGDDVLYGDDGNDRIFGSFGNDRMYGGTGVDELGGQAGNDTMYGGAGNDKLGGGTGNDLLYGDADADVLSGREGLDRLTGGTGNDIFDYDMTTDSKPGSANRDVIYDFAGVGKAVGDRIDLSTIDANTAKAGNQAFVFKGAGAITSAGQVHVIASGGDTLIQANTGGSNAPELEILVKDGTALHTQWIAGDFIL